MFSGKPVLSKLLLPLLMILILSITGCGSNKAPENSKDGTTPAPQTTKPGVVTYENYLKITLDMTYDDVKGILGEGKKKEVKTDVIKYTWEEQDKNIVIQTNKSKVESKTQNGLGKTTPTLTVEQFDKITTGMTIDQAVSVLGPDYREETLKYSDNLIRRDVVWMLPDSTYIKVNLLDGKVISKNNKLKK
ncbi:hypothetical protein [Desulfosporosinus fructosivorans]